MDHQFQNFITSVVSRIFCKCNVLLASIVRYTFTHYPYNTQIETAQHNICKPGLGFTRSPDTIRPRNLLGLFRVIKLSHCILSQLFDTCDNHSFSVLFLSKKRITFHFLENKNKVRIFVFWTKCWTKIKWLSLVICVSNDTVTLV